uniref:Cytochrome b-c1 complex subunit 8 n=1 Tax=Macrostomum lignano TaxID=282301 RepID=A0A1I8F4R5_9PLAT
TRSRCIGSQSRAVRFCKKRKGKKWCTKAWGQGMAYVRGIIYYSVSPNELHPFRGLLTKAPWNALRRRSEFFRVTRHVLRLRLPRCPPALCASRRWPRPRRRPGSMLRGVGLKSCRFCPAAGWGGVLPAATVTPCNLNLRELQDLARWRIASARPGWCRCTSTPSRDGHQHGHAWHAAVADQPEVIADSIETVTLAEGFDGLVCLGACDKNMPGMAMAMLRINRPALFVYGGSILPGCGPKGDKVDIRTVYEAIGGYHKGSVSDKELSDIEECAIRGRAPARACTPPTQCPAPWSYGPRSARRRLAAGLKRNGARRAPSGWRRASQHDAVRDSGARRHCHETGAGECGRRGFRAGGSTNACLHLVAIAREAGLADFGLDELQSVFQRTPVLADLFPAAATPWPTCTRLARLRPLLRRMLSAGLLHGSAVTCTGRTLAEDLKGVEDYPAGRRLFGQSDPIKATYRSSDNLPRQSLLPNGAVGKLIGDEGDSFSGPAIVYENEEAAYVGVSRGQVQPGHVVGRGLSGRVALITDGRFSGATKGFLVGHVTQSQLSAGQSARFVPGDQIEIDGPGRQINVRLAEVRTGRPTVRGGYGGCGGFGEAKANHRRISHLRVGEVQTAGQTG